MEAMQATRGRSPSTPPCLLASPPAEDIGRMTHPMVVLDDVPVTIIGHPWAPIGMGEQLRSYVHACNAVHLHHRVFDIFRYAQRVDAAHGRLLGGLEIAVPPDGVRIFHVNGDEVDAVVAAFEARGGDFAAGYNIIVPAWELPAYPKVWAAKLRRFDEVWALSSFIERSLAASGIASHLVGQAVEFEAGVCLPRRHFDIREAAFVMLHFFDLSSYPSRKNPAAVLALFDRVRAGDPYRDVQLVLKVKNGEKAAEAWAAGVADDPQIKVISVPLDTLGVKSLINACDVFVSLHRAEGFGRGLGEAMGLGRIGLGTGWSGNVDFMTPENSLMVRHDIVKLKKDDYPHWRGQEWADADVAHAHALLAPLLDDPAAAADLARRGQADVLRTHGSRAVGLRILNRLTAIVATAPRFNG